tara:strand:- start:718 stop:969 length:252 start_codon:yes stop_codon:yes gene_type:complete
MKMVTALITILLLLVLLFTLIIQLNRSALDTYIEYAIDINAFNDDRILTPMGSTKINCSSKSERLSRGQSCTTAYVPKALEDL